MAPILASPRVLTIQSHVVSGYCGNKSATFPLQLLEFEVDVVNTVQLSNNTRYKVVRGQIYKSKDLDELYAGLKANNLLSLYDHILSGYVADVSYIESMAKMIRDIKAERQNRGLDCWYTFDPVLGDDGTGYYVPGGAIVAEAYKKNLLPLADIITPNRFEASILSGIEIGTSPDDALSEAMKAISVLHDFSIRVVIVTSFAIEDKHKDQLTCIVSHKPQALGSDHPPEAWVIRVPKLDCPFTGTGDLFAALMTGWLRNTNFDFKKSLENTANSIHDILEDTLAWYQSVNDGSLHSHELRLVQNKLKIMFPSNEFKADKIEVHLKSNDNIA